MKKDFFKKQRKTRLRRLARTEETKDRCKREVYKNDLEQNVDVHLTNKKHPWKMPKFRPIGITSELYNTLKNIAYMKDLKLSHVWKVSCDILTAVFEMILHVEQRPKDADWMAVQWENHCKRLFKNTSQTSKIVKLQKEFNMDDDFENLNTAQGF